MSIQAADRILLPQDTTTSVFANITGQKIDIEQLILCNQDVIPVLYRVSIAPINEADQRKHYFIWDDTLFEGQTVWIYFEDFFKSGKFELLPGYEVRVYVDNDMLTSAQVLIP